MEYAKKFYHLCYRRWYVPAFASMESKLGPETTGVIIRAFAGQDKPRGLRPSRFGQTNLPQVVGDCDGDNSAIAMVNGEPREPLERTQDLISQSRRMADAAATMV
jgi:hypothetical protein